MPKAKVFRTFGSMAWVPKDVLKTKLTSISLNPQPSTQVWCKRTSERRDHTQVCSQHYMTQVKQVWKRKQSKSRPSREKDVNDKSRMIWRPKQKESSKPTTQVHQAQTSEVHKEDKRNANTRMKFRALDLQLKLFGFSSVLLLNQTWLELVRTQQGYVRLPANARPTRKRAPKNMSSTPQA